MTTSDGTILDGHARWQVAREKEQPTLPCFVYDVSEEEAVEIVIQRHQAMGGLNAYARIRLALLLEPRFRKEVASFGEKIISRGRPSSNLTAGESRDVRQDIARIACVSTGNVTKVKQLMDGVVPAIQEQLLRGAVSIHRAWQWRTLSERAQRDALWAYLHRRNIGDTIRQLVSSHVKSPPPLQAIDIAPTIIRGLSTCDLADLAVAVVDIPGRAVVVTRAFYNDLQRCTDAPR